jgi:hypothetical protein
MSWVQLWFTCCDQLHFHDPSGPSVLSLVCSYLHRLLAPSAGVALCMLFSCWRELVESCVARQHIADRQLQLACSKWEDVEGVTCLYRLTDADSQGRNLVLYDA